MEGWQNGQGTYNYTGGNKYVGAWKDGKGTDKAPLPTMEQIRR